MGWVETVAGAKVVRRKLIAGGNRRQSWSLELDHFGVTGADKVPIWANAGANMGV